MLVLIGIKQPKLQEALRLPGSVFWWDNGEDGIGWGDNWIEKLQEKLNSCSSYLILVGPSGVRRWVKAELLIALRRHFENDLPIFPVLLDGALPESLPPFLGIFQAERLSGSLNEVDFAGLAQKLLTAASIKVGDLLVKNDVCPFPGLEAFNEDDAIFFFGRQSETLDALRRLGPGLDGIYRRWLQIEGPSGVGKSSLIRAGLVPTIKRGWLEEDHKGESQEWHISSPMRPGIDPIENLAEALVKTRDLQCDRSVGELIREFRNDAQALRHFMRQYVQKDHGFVLVVDQLEEVFTLTSRSENRRHFDILLAEAVKDIDGPLHLITTIRSDFMLRFREMPQLEGLLNDSAGRYLLRSMNEAGLRDIVRTPARLAGLKWSDNSLPDEIVEEALSEPGALPLVGNLLRLLWNERQDSVLAASAYRELGGLGGALAGRADQLIESLGRDGRDRARKLLIALVEPGRESQDSRRTITREMALNAAGGGKEAEVVLDRLSGLRDAATQRGANAMPRLVVVSGDGEDQSDSARSLVDLAHEALLRDDRRGEPYWKTLRGWVETYRNQLEDRRLIEILAEKWLDLGKSWRSPELARGRQLNEFNLIEAPMSEVAVSYLQASQRLKWIRISIVGALFVPFVASLATGWWINQKGVDNLVFARALWIRIGFTNLAVPEMVELQSGVFLMGSPEYDGEDERKFEDVLKNRITELKQSHPGPQHEVKVSAFAIGKYEVTFADHDTCRALGGCLTRPPDQRRGRGGRPVYNVDWDHAQEYCSWLSEMTGEPYRLPTEAEWEYAARAGTETRFATGDEITTKQALFNQASFDAREVSSYPPNNWGLHDMHGNLAEWVQDHWHDNYEGAPADGSAWLGGDYLEPDLFRVNRGGHYFSSADFVASSARAGNNSYTRNQMIGFRCARGKGNG